VFESALDGSARSVAGAVPVDVGQHLLASTMRSAAKTHSTTAGQPWKVERTHAWISGYGKLLRCTHKKTNVVDFYLYLAAALTMSERSSAKPDPATGNPRGQPPDACDDLDCRSL